MWRQFLSVAVLPLPFLHAMLCHPAPASSYVNIERRAPSGSNTVIIQMFEWTWDSIAAECTNFIGPAGYGFVQVSPPQEHIQGSQWWTDYQPVSYILTSKRGNRSQFANMINVCHTAGVKVIADTIFNHMTGIDSGTGVAGSSFTHYNYPGIYQDQDFHHCGLEPGDDIVNYDNRVEVQTCELENLADLATETEYVRSQLATYANDLLSLGVDGLRLDAAKHIAASDLANITSRLSTKPYITQEVIYGTGEPITPNEYTGIGDVQEFRYTTALKSAFLGGGISTLQNLDNLGWVPSGQANVFVTNHDTERNGNSLNNNSPSNTYVTATIFSLAHIFGTPSILSSYSGFTNTDAGAPNGGTGTCSGSGGTNGWLCQHRWTAFVGMVGFRNNVGTAPLTNWVSPQSQQIAFGRGTLGFVAINNADSDWTNTFSTTLPEGSYCDVVSGQSSSGQCTGSSFTVSGGAFTATIPARSAVAIHTGAMGQGSGNSGGGSSGSVIVNFAETATTTFGEVSGVDYIVYRESVQTAAFYRISSWSGVYHNLEIGIQLLRYISCWGILHDDSNRVLVYTLTSQIPLSSATYPVWTASITLPPNTNFQFKFIRKETDGSIVWESDPNRQDTTPASESQSVSTSWR